MGETGSVKFTTGAKKDPSTGSGPNGGRDPMRDHGPELPLIPGEKFKRTKGGGLGWLLHEGLDLFETKVLAFKETGAAFDAKTDKLILDMLIGMARNDGVSLTLGMVRKARQALGYKAFERHMKPKHNGKMTAGVVTDIDTHGAPDHAGEAVSDVDPTGAPVKQDAPWGSKNQHSDPRGASARVPVKIEGQVMVGNKLVNPGRMTLLAGLRWDEEIMAGAIERLASGMPAENPDEDVVMRGVRALVEAETMAASPNLHGLLAMFPDGMKEYMRCVFRVLERLGVEPLDRVGAEDGDRKVKCFGSWHRQHSYQCAGCKSYNECFKVSADAREKEAAEALRTSQITHKVGASPNLQELEAKVRAGYTMKPEELEVLNDARSRLDMPPVENMAAATSPVIKETATAPTT
jgi:hypothetical protein